VTLNLEELGSQEESNVSPARGQFFYVGPVLYIRFGFCVSVFIAGPNTGCAKKVTPFWYLSFLALLDTLFAIFVYLHIIFIKCLISEPCVVSIQMDKPAGWCTIAHCEQHDKLPQKGECFIHRASDVASKQP